MLRAIRLENFRSFADSGRVELADLNVFIGPNSAGKTNLMTAVEVALRGVPATDSGSPLNLVDLPSFAAFDSLLRRNGAGRRRQGEFAFTYDWSAEPASEVRWQRFLFRRSAASGAAFVRRVEYGAAGTQALSAVEASDSNGRAYRVAEPHDLAGQPDVMFTAGAWVVYWKKLRADAGRARMTALPGATLEFVRTQGLPRKVLVVRPHRPVPRSVYVLDDPLMSVDDRELVSDLLRFWSQGDEEEARERVLEGLRVMTLAADMDVRSITRGQGTAMVEVRVAPHEKGRSVTLADVGYGVSQVLPLLAQDAQLSDSNLLVYQPEAHLHPLAQSRLADVFVASVKRGNRAYVETHSEHLVLRLQALIAGGTIEPDRVRVFCVEHDGHKSTVQSMLFDERGIPKSRWPRGFLDTGLELARDLAQKRQSRPPTGKRDG
jgi:hypothetical protein